MLFTCDWKNCTATFKRRDRFRAHLWLHEGERPFRCTFKGCLKSFTQLSHLQRHAAIHENKEFKCDIDGCAFILKTKATLKKHKDRMHLNVKPKTYKCETCSKEFVKHSLLRSHVVSHTGVLPYLCSHPGCERRFSYPCKLKKHLEHHNGYTCEKSQCEKHFSTWTEYTHHLKINHPKLHKCPACGKEFLRSNNFRKHMSMHSDDKKVFVCDVPNCSKFYLAKRNLAIHKKEYHEKRTHVCDQEYCNRAFKTERDLEDHQWRHKKSNKKKKRRPTLAEKLSGYPIPEDKSESDLADTGDDSKIPIEQEDSKPPINAEITHPAMKMQEKLSDHVKLGSETLCSSAVTERLNEKSAESINSEVLPQNCGNVEINENKGSIASTILCRPTPVQ